MARAGPDLALAIVLVASAVALLRRWPVAEVLVAMAAALLLSHSPAWLLLWRGPPRNRRERIRRGPQVGIPIRETASLRTA